MLSRHDSRDSPSTLGIWVRSRRSPGVERAARAEAARADGRCWGWLDANFALNEYCCCIHIRCHVPGYLVPGTGYREPDVVYTPEYVVSCVLWSPYHTKKMMCFFFLIRSIRNYTCLHEFKNEVTNRRGKKTPFLNLKKKNIRNSLMTNLNIFPTEILDKKKKMRTLLTNR